MAREKPFYRENMEILNSRYPDHDMLLPSEVAAVMGWKSKKTTHRYLEGMINPIGRVSKAVVANFMCGGKE